MLWTLRSRPGWKLSIHAEIEIARPIAEAEAVTASPVQVPTNNFLFEVRVLIIAVAAWMAAVPWRIILALLIVVFGLAGVRLLMKKEEA